MPNATQLLRQDHKKVEGLFSKFEQASERTKRRIAEQCMLEIDVHAKIEEEIFYPAVRREVGDGEMLDEAKQEHQAVKELIRELKSMDGEEDAFESKFSDLMEKVKHHVEEEENEMFPQVEESELDLAELGAEMAKRKQDLMKSAGSTAGGKTRKTKSQRPRSGSTRSRKRARA